MYIDPYHLFAIKEFNSAERNILRLHARNTELYGMRTVILNHDINTLDFDRFHCDNTYYLFSGTCDNVQQVLDTLPDCLREKVIGYHLWDVPAQNQFEDRPVRIDIDTPGDLAAVADYLQTTRNSVTLLVRELETPLRCLSSGQASSRPSVSYVWNQCWKSNPFNGTLLGKFNQVTNPLNRLMQIERSGFTVGLGWFSKLTYCGAQHRNHRYLISGTQLEYRCLYDYWNEVEDCTASTSLTTVTDQDEIFPGSDIEAKEQRIRNSHIHRVTVAPSNCKDLSCCFRSKCNGGCAPVYNGHLYCNLICGGDMK